MPLLQIAAAVFAANFFTILFLWGLWKARNIPASGEGLTFAIFSALAGPPLLMAGGLWYYWSP